MPDLDFKTRFNAKECFKDHGINTEIDAEARYVIDLWRWSYYRDLQNRTEIWHQIIADILGYGCNL